MKFSRRGFCPNRTKVLLGLAASRLRVMQQKSSALALQQHKSIAKLLEEGKAESARVRGETLIRDDLYREALEALELFCELLASRIAMLDNKDEQCDPYIRECVCSILYGIKRVECPELHQISEQLTHRFGKEFVTESMADNCKDVSPRLVSKLACTVPEPALIDNYLVEIARTYKVRWTPPPRPPSASGNSKPPPSEHVALAGEGQQAPPASLAGAPKSSHAVLTQSMGPFSTATVDPAISAASMSRHGSTDSIDVSNTLAMNAAQQQTPLKPQKFAELAPSEFPKVPALENPIRVPVVPSPIPAPSVDPEYDALLARFEALKRA